MWLSALFFLMNTVVAGHHFNELEPSQGGPIFLCSFICYVVLAYQCCSAGALTGVSFFVVWASILTLALLSLFETWALISAAWCFSAICCQVTVYWYKTRPVY